MSDKENLTHRVSTLAHKKEDRSIDKVKHAENRLVCVSKNLGIVWKEKWTVKSGSLKYEEQNAICDDGKE